MTTAAGSPGREPPTTPEVAATTEPPSSTGLATLGWWAVTLVTLVVLDDLTFGPVFWAISRFGSPIAGFLAALAIYVPVQIALVRAGTSDDPSRFARFFLDRLDLDRRSRHVAAREEQMRARVTGIASSLGLSLVIGGVLPPLVLWRSGFSTRFVRRLSWATALVYAVEFSFLHGYLPGLI